MDTKYLGNNAVYATGDLAVFPAGDNYAVMRVEDNEVTESAVGSLIYADAKTAVNVARSVERRDKRTDLGDIAAKVIAAREAA